MTWQTYNIFRAFQDHLVRAFDIWQPPKRYLWTKGGELNCFRGEFMGFVIN